MNQKPGDVGWMYHTAPRSRVDDEPESYPPPSQIPGLNGEEIIPDESVQGWIKDTDSKYIQLAKQGGRPDLLRFKENFGHNKEAKGYPRCEWFYIEDNKMDDARQGREENQGPYVPRLPDYMVHEAYVPSASSPPQHQHQDVGKFRPKRLPYAENTETVYERDGRSATDKTMRIPEARKPGYGIRSANNEGKMKKTPMPERAKNATRGEARPDHIPEDETAPSMGKLLAMTYDKEWHDRCYQWQVQQEKAKPKVTVATKKPDAMPLSVYRQEFGPPPQKREVKHGRRSAGAAEKRDQSGAGNIEMNREIHKMEKDLENKELFKLSKFKKVQSKLDTNRHQNQARAQKSEGFVY